VVNRLLYMRVCLIEGLYEPSGWLSNPSWVMIESAFCRTWGRWLEGDFVRLIQEIAKGDMDAFCTLYNDMQRDVFNCAYVVLHNYHAAEDVQQNTFLKILTSASKFNGDNRADIQARDWILTIARNLARDYWKKRKNEVITGEIGLRRAPLSSFDLDCLHEKMDVFALIESLPKALADVVVLHNLGSFTLDECAKELRISVPTVKRRCRKGIQLLRERIELQQSTAKKYAKDPRGNEDDEILA
jgi:RNA polymerase sigma factor (sigma-70 family)